MGKLVFFPYMRKCPFACWGILLLLAPCPFSAILPHNEPRHPSPMLDRLPGGNGCVRPRVLRGGPLRKELACGGLEWPMRGANGDVPHHSRKAPAQGLGCRHHGDPCSANPHVGMLLSQEILEGDNCSLAGGVFGPVVLCLLQLTRGNGDRP
jgi:hypothetical protein